MRAGVVFGGAAFVVAAALGGWGVYEAQTTPVTVEIEDAGPEDAAVEDAAVEDAA